MKVGVLAAFRPPTLLIYRTSDDGRIAGMIPGRIAGRRNDIARGIGIVWGMASRHRAPRFSGILRKRILSGESFISKRTSRKER